MITKCEYGGLACIRLRELHKYTFALWCDSNSKCWNTFSHLQFTCSQIPKISSCPSQHICSAVVHSFTHSLTSFIPIPWLSHFVWPHEIHIQHSFRVDNLLKPLIRGAVYLPCIQPKKLIPNDILKWYSEIRNVEFIVGISKSRHHHHPIPTIHTHTHTPSDELSHFLYMHRIIRRIESVVFTSD